MKNAAVIGANRGIGLELCRQLKKNEFEVTAFCRKASDDLRGTEAKVIENCEVTDSGSLRQAAEGFTDHHFDVFVHVAGIMRETSFPNFEEKDIIDQFTVNALGPLLSIRAFQSKIKNGAKVGLLTSRMGSIADNSSGGAYGYRMSKAALNAAAKSLSIDLAEHKWTLLTLHPGWVQTDMTRNTGNLTPEESAKGLIRLLLEKGPEDTGKFFHVNGEGLPW